MLDIAQAKCHLNNIQALPDRDRWKSINQATALTSAHVIASHLKRVSVHLYVTFRSELRQAGVDQYL